MATEKTLTLVDQKNLCAEFAHQLTMEGRERERQRRLAIYKSIYAANGKEVADEFYANWGLEITPDELEAIAERTTRVWDDDQNDAMESEDDELDSGDEDEPHEAYMERLFAHQANQLYVYTVKLRFPKSGAPVSKEEIKKWYRSFIPTVPGTKTPRLLSPFNPRVQCGFTAKLSYKHVEAMEKMPGFVSAISEETGMLF